MFRIIFTLALLFPLASQATARFEARIAIDGVAQTGDVIEVEAKEMKWAIRFFYKDTDTQLKKFKMSHMKAMHMIIVKDDHTKISHVHPMLNMHDMPPMPPMLHTDPGTFMVTMNKATDDPDNQDLKSVFMEPGDYIVYMEFSPDEGPSMPVPDLVTQRVRVNGTWNRRALQKDRVSRTGRITKYFKEDGSAGVFEDKYEVQLTRQVTQGCNGNIIEFFFEIFQWESRDIMGDTIEGYFEVTDLKPWLMMDGHAVLLPDVQNLSDVKFEHMHTMRDGNTNVLKFTMFDKPGRLSDDLSRMYVQLRHDTDVRTFHFTFDREYTEPTIIHCE